MTTAAENMENPTQKFTFESETQAEKEKREMSSKRVKAIGGILILCFLLLNFILVGIVMNRTSEISPSSSTEDFSAVVNRTRETGENVDQLKFKLDGIEKWINSTEEKFESHQVQIEALSNRTKIDKQAEALENENRTLKKFHEELQEQFESLSQKIDQLENDISSGQNVSFLMPTESTELAENKDQSPTDPQTLQNCRDAMKQLSSPRSKKQTIYPHGNGTSFEVLCDFETDGGGWTIIQRRTSGPKDEFNRNWENYTEGFGSPNGNFWIGLDNIRALTQNGDQELRIELEDFEGEKRWAKYSTFSISDASDFYKLAISGFFANSTAGDSMTITYAANGARFSTRDKDHSTLRNMCAAYYSTGGWWINSCFHASLNGLYQGKGETVPYATGIFWHSWTGLSKSLAKTEMKIRTRK